MPTDADWTAAVALLRAAREVTVLAHVNPDADALGSALALGTVLHRRGARVVVSFAEPATAPRALSSLDVEGLLVPASQVPAASELVVAMDSGSVDRLGALGDRLGAAGAALVIDHHASNTRFGTHHVVDERAEATAVLVLGLLDRLDVTLDEPVARCLYAGLVTDTSGFRRASPGTHQIAARLVAAGVRTDELTRSLMGAHPFSWLRMLATVLGGATLLPAAAGGRGLVYAVVRAADLDGIEPDEVESVVDIVRTTREAEVCAVLKELVPGRWSVSLRAVSEVDVRSIAVALGGGGHRLAAGFTVHGSQDDAVRTLLTAIG